MLDSLTHSRLNTAIHTHRPAQTYAHTLGSCDDVFLFVIVIDRFVCVCVVVSCRVSVARSPMYLLVWTRVRVFVRLFSRVSFGSFALLSMGFLI